MKVSKMLRISKSCFCVILLVGLVINTGCDDTSKQTSHPITSSADKNNGVLAQNQGASESEINNAGLAVSGEVEVVAIAQNLAQSSNLMIDQVTSTGQLSPNMKSPDISIKITGVVDLNEIDGEVFSMSSSPSWLLEEAIDQDGNPVPIIASKSRFNAGQNSQNRNLREIIQRWNNSRRTKPNHLPFYVGLIHLDERPRMLSSIKASTEVEVVGKIEELHVKLDPATKQAKVNDRLSVRLVETKNRSSASYQRWMLQMKEHVGEGKIPLVVSASLTDETGAILTSAGRDGFNHSNMNEMFFLFSHETRSNERAQPAGALLTIISDITSKKVTVTAEQIPIP